MYPATSNILVVDDMLTMRKLVMKALRELGYSSFTEAADGAKAWEAFSGADKPFDLIVSDWNMPNASGLDLLKRVRSDSRFGKTPFFLLTAEGDKEQVIEAVKAGVTGYILKPFTPDSIKAQMANGWAKKDA